MTPYRPELEAALEALRRSWDVIDTYGQPGFYHGCAFLFDRPTGGFDEDVSFSEEYGDQRPGKIAREWLPDLERAIARAEEALRSPPSRPDFRASWNPPSNYSDAYDWHQYLDKPEEKESQQVNGPGTAVDSRSAASMSSSAFHSQPSGIVSSGAPTPSRATHVSPPEPEKPTHDELDIDGEPYTGDRLAEWLETKFKRHGEDEDAAAARWIRRHMAASEPEKPAARRLTKKELEDAAFPVLRAVNSDRLWRELTYSSGPYEVTCAKHVLVDIARALESAIAALWGVKLP